jgi:nicotinamide mononucleotide transporter
MLQRLLEGLRATDPLEWLAFGAGVFYVVLILKRHRAGWIFGGISALALMILFWRSMLPMNALLQFSYVVAAVYGWWRWSAAGAVQRIGVWHWRGHALALVSCLVVSVGLWQLLRSEGYSAFPFADSLVACVGLLATWLVARVYLENWLYWIVVDALTIWLCLAQGMYVPLLLYVVYLVIAVAGFFDWWNRYRRQAAVP